MLLFTLENNAADVVRHLDADHGKQNLRGSAHAFTVQGSLLCDHGLCQLILLLLGSQIAALLSEHVMHQLVHNGGNRHDLLLRDAGKVVVEGAAVHNILSRLADISRLVHQCGRVAGAGADALFAAG